MGIGESVGDLVGSGITRRYPKFRFALCRRHGSSPAASTAANNDVLATRRRRSSHVVCSADTGSLLETAISQFAPFLCNRRDANRGGFHVQSGLACAATVLGNHRFGVGLQRRVDDRAGHCETWALSHSGSCPIMEAIAI